VASSGGAGRAQAISQAIDAALAAGLETNRRRIFDGEQGEQFGQGGNHGVDDEA
jgi:hypothetical protein